jgi:hypothetical protein
MGGCLAIARILLTCVPAITKPRMFLLCYTLLYVNLNMKIYHLELRYIVLCVEGILSYRKVYKLRIA